MSQLVSVSFMAIFQDDPMAVFGATALAVRSACLVLLGQQKGRFDRAALSGSFLPCRCSAAVGATDVRTGCFLAVFWTVKCRACRLRCLVEDVVLCV